MTNTLEPGSYSTATMREQDLIPTFVAALEGIGTPAAEYADEWQRLDAVADDARDGDWYESAGYLLSDLFDALDGYCPDGHYFGAHPGDGSDYGVWPVEDFDAE